MRRTITDLLILFLLSLSGSTCLVAQNLSADSFLNNLSAHPVGDQAEKDQAAEIAMSLNSASRSDVERVLPAVLASVRAGNEARVRSYAIGFLLMVAMRPDGVALLSSKSEEISSLIVDPNPGVQRGALAAMGYLIGKTGTDNHPYVLAMQAAIRQTQTPQAADVEMIRPLLAFSGGDPEALKSVLAFMQREDLTRSTRVDLVLHLGVDGGLPTEVNQVLTKELDDPDPWVRAAAVRVFADSTSEYHTLAKNRIERMANDPEEAPHVRELAKEATAGKTHLNPDINPPPEKGDSQ